MAQPGSALVWGTSGRWFKSSHPDHSIPMTSNKNKYSFVIVLPGGNKSLSLHIPKWVLICVISTLILSIILLIVSIYFTSNTSYKNNAYQTLKKENKSLKTQLTQINTSLDQLQTQYQRIVDKEYELQLLLGDTKIRKRTYRQKKRIKKKITHLNKDYSDLSLTYKTPTSSAHAKLNWLQTKLGQQNTSFTVFLDKTYQLKDRFSSTPSIRPIYGRLQSNYGWRYHPIHRKRKFHNGIDFSSWIGAPIQSTADGIIEYAGWSGSFGFVIVIDHDYGYRTIYAHCSQLLVEKGNTVKKGQIIAQVGNGHFNRTTPSLRNSKMAKTSESC